MTRLRRVDPVAEELLTMLAKQLRAGGRSFAIASLDARLRSIAGEEGFPAVDSALEHYEDMLLARVLEAEAIGPPAVALGEFSLFSGWTAERLEALARHLHGRGFTLGEMLIEAGSPARSLYFLTEGRVNVSITVGGGVTRRISTIDAGNVFGELAIFG